MSRGVPLVAALAAGLLLTGCGGVDEHAYVARNKAILRSLPVFPGAVKAQGFSTPDDRSEGGWSTRPSSYVTTVVYRVPRGTRGPSVLRFYETRLQRRGWQASGSPPIMSFTRAQALVALNCVLLMPAVRSRHRSWTYEIAVDHRGANR